MTANTAAYVYVIGSTAAFVFFLKMLRILGGTRTYIDASTLLTMFSGWAFWAGVVMSWVAKPKAAICCLAGATILAASLVQLEDLDHPNEKRPGRYFLFAGIALLLCAAFLPAITKNAAISLSAVLASTLIMVKGDLFSAVACLRRKILAR